MLVLYNITSYSSDIETMFTCTSKIHRLLEIIKKVNFETN